jgi:selenocysteine lyase/cysteine desulfurase
VALFDNSTHAWNAAFYSVPLGPGDRILTGRDEYGSSVLAYLQVARRSGAEIVVVPNDGDGQIDLGALARLADERTKLIGLTWVPTSGGLVNPAAAVGRIARDVGALYLLDATQAVGQFLGERLREDLGQLPGVTTHDLGPRRCAIVTAKIAGRSADDVAAALGRAGINVSATAPEQNPLDTEERGIHPLVRFSPHYYNTEAEIDRTVAAVAELASAASRP